MQNVGERWKALPINYGQNPMAKYDETAPYEGFLSEG